MENIASLVPPDNGVEFRKLMPGQMHVFQFGELAFDPHFTVQMDNNTHPPTITYVANGGGGRMFYQRPQYFNQRLATSDAIVTPLGEVIDFLPGSIIKVIGNMVHIWRSN